jgi:hypothetical protein
LIAKPRTTELCRIAARQDTDKQQSYTQVYDRLLAAHRDAPLRLLEIGLYNGGSLRMWREYLPNATLHGIDIDERTLAYQDEIPNTQVRLVDQGDVGALRAFVAELGGGYDFIVDDGGHFMEQQIVSFEVLFGQVTAGGVYVIEDLGTSYWVEYGGRGLGEPGTAVAHAKHLADAVNLEHMVPVPGWTRAVPAVELARLRTDVAGVAFHPGQAVITKL